ncbi:tetratricopeptide repeat protein [Melioribacteraceae bacterium 4301-Me]|uniref:tetratricopeptide repeat protein n=1 Tax=Pyranulibacter aquaticus TaxID=3163344 RepID=UPI00359AB9E3
MNRLKFANYLFSQSDYLRAAEEYRAFLKEESNDTARFKLAESLLNISRFSEAADHFKEIFFNRDLGDYAKLEFYRSLFLSRNYSFFRQTVNQENYLPEKFLLEVKRLGAISYFFDNISLPDSTAFLQYFISDSVKSKIKDFYLRKKFPSYKSPLKASLLSAVLPGSGKIYSGQISDGITAFVATSILTFLAIDNFNASHRFRGWLFSGLALLSYAGNIYGSAASAQLYNAEIRFNLDKEIKLYFEKRNYFLPSIDFIK